MSKFIKQPSLSQTSIMKRIRHQYLYLRFIKQLSLSQTLTIRRMMHQFLHKILKRKRRKKKDFLTSVQSLHHPHRLLPLNMTNRRKTRTKTMWRLSKMQKIPLMRVVAYPWSHFSRNKQQLLLRKTRKKKSATKTRKINSLLQIRSGMPELKSNMMNFYQNT